jgi:hypothetical protein
MIKVLLFAMLFIGCSNQLDIKEINYSKSLKISQKNQLLITKYNLVSQSLNAPIFKEAWFEYIGNYRGGEFKNRNGDGKQILIAVENCLDCFNIDNFLKEWDMEKSDDFNFGVIKNNDKGGLFQLFPKQASVTMDTITLRFYKKIDFAEKTTVGYIIISPVK